MSKEGYVYIDKTADGANKAFSDYGKSAMDNFQSVSRGSINEIVTDVSVRPAFTSFEKDYFRPNDAMPHRFPEIINACRNSYYNVGLVRNVIDILVDFACSDLRLLHHDKKTEAFFRVWAKKVDLYEAVQEFTKHFFIESNVVVKRITGKLTVPVEKQLTRFANAKSDIKLAVDTNEVESREIPWKYIFLNIQNLNWMDGYAARIAGKARLGLRVSPFLLRTAKEKDPAILENLPEDLRNILEKGNSSFTPLDMTKIHVAHNKKNSWEPWAVPFLVAILSDLQFREKLRKAEISVLDGTINTIRLWKLGDHKEGVFPSEQAFSKLVNLLNTNTGGGTMDIIWDSMIDLKTEYPPIEKILGSDKYQQVEKDLITGLGIPDVLLGGGGGAVANSWIQLKSLIERLSYVRKQIRKWLEIELEMVAKAMGFDSIPKIYFNEDNLQDESVKQKLIVQLLDRNIISAEAVLNTFGQDFMFEVERIKSEKPVLKEAGIERMNPLDPPLPPVTPGAKAPAGRPDFSKDSMKRKTKKIKSTASTSILYAMDALDFVDEEIIPEVMAKFGVDNLRKLTSEQKDQINNVRSTILACINIDDDLNKDNLITKSSNKDNVDKAVLEEIDNQIANFMAEKGKAPTMTQRKRLSCLAWAAIKDKVEYDNI